MKMAHNTTSCSVCCRQTMVFIQSSVFSKKCLYLLFCTYVRRYICVICMYIHACIVRACIVKNVTNFYVHPFFAKCTVKVNARWLFTVSFKEFQLKCFSFEKCWWKWFSGFTNVYYVHLPKMACKAKGKRGICPGRHFWGGGVKNSLSQWYYLYIICFSKVKRSKNKK